MDPDFLLRGLIIGFSIAVAVGPINILCIHRTLADGRTIGLLSGLGAATGDAFYAFIAGFGLTFLSRFLVGQQRLLLLAGGVFLCYLGIKTFLSNPNPKGEMSGEKGIGKTYSYSSTFLLTVTNPMTIILFTAAFAGLGMGSVARDYNSAGLLVIGVFCGSTVWRIVLSGILSMIQERFTTVGLRCLNRVSGVIITGFGAYALFLVI